MIQIAADGNERRTVGGKDGTSVTRDEGVYNDWEELLGAIKELVPNLKHDNTAYFQAIAERPNIGQRKHSARNVKADIPGSHHLHQLRHLYRWSHHLYYHPSNPQDPHPRQTANTFITPATHKGNAHIHVSTLTYLVGWGGGKDLLFLALDRAARRRLSNVLDVAPEAGLCEDCVVLVKHLSIIG